MKNPAIPIAFALTAFALAGAFDLLRRANEWAKG